MSWTKDSINYKVSSTSNTNMQANFNLNDSLKTKYTSDFKAAEFVYWQPYKLLEAALLWHYAGTDTLEDGTKVEVVEIQYLNPDGSNGNTWWFYFNSITYRLEGNMVHHGTTYSYIRNLVFEDQSGLSLNAKRVSYRCDKDRNIEFVRAQYDYSLNSIQYK